MVTSVEALKLEIGMGGFEGLEDSDDESALSHTLHQRSTPNQISKEQ